MRARARAALEAIGIAQKELAAELGITTQTLNSQLTTGTPSRLLIAYLFRRYGVSFNFVCYGEWGDLPAGLVAGVETALRASRR